MADINISKLKLPNDNNTYHYKDTVSGYKSTDATQSEHGLLSTTDKIKLDGIATGAEVNQNAFSNVKVGSTTVAADSKTDTLELVGGANITLTPDATNDKITISLDDTVDTGEVIATDIQAGNLIVNGTSRFLNTINGTASNSEKLNGQSLTSTYSSTGTAPITGAAVASAIGTLDGTVSGSPSASKTLTAFSQTDGKVSATFGNISITKSQVSDFPTLGTAAAKNYTTSVTNGSADLVTSGAVWTAIDNLPEPMVFKGSLGTGGTITDLPVNGTAKVGDTYKVIEAKTYAGKAAKIGDTFICLTKTSSANTWELIPSGDEPSGTVTSVGISNGGGLSVSGSPITSSGTITISHADTSSQASVNNSGRTYIQDITLDTYGHVTGIASATETVVNTDRYVNSAAFAHDSTNDNVKMTLTRAGSDTATVTANIPKVSNSSSGVAPKGATVSSQSQTTKFLREDGTWQAPSYTPVIDNLTSSTSTTSALSAKQGYLLANGSARDNTKLPLAGGTMTGLLKAQANIYTDSYTGALDMQNSNIYGVNSIITADLADNAGEGIHFYRDSTHVDTLWVAGGDIMFVPNRALGTSTTAANSQKVGRFTANPTSGQVVITDGTTGGMKSSGYTIAKSVPSNADFTNTWRPVENVLTSTSTTNSLSAAQGKYLQEHKSEYRNIGTAQDHQRVVIALCEVSANANAGTSSHTSGTIATIRSNGLVGEYLAMFTFQDYYLTAKSASYSTMGNYQNTSTTARTGEGYRPCIFTYNSKHYAGLEFFQTQARTFYWYGEGNFEPFLVAYYNMNSSTVLNTEIDGSITYSTDNLKKKDITVDGATNDSDGNAINSTYLKLAGGQMTGDIIIPKNDNMGIKPNTNNYGEIGHSNLYFYRSFITHYYGTTSHVTNWDSNGNIGSPATSSAASSRGYVNFYNTCAAGGTQTKTTLYAHTDANANTNILLPKNSGTLITNNDICPAVLGTKSYGTSADNRNKKIKIKINATNSWMLCFTVTLYQGYRATKVMISGYQYGSNHWHQPEARLLGDSDGTETISVYFGYDSVNNLWVGFDGDLYTGVVITDVVNGYSQISDFSDLFTISTEDSLATLQTTVTASSRANYAISAGSASTATTATTASRVSATAGTADANRHVWFSDGSTETARCYDDDFKYNPSTNVLTVSSITGSAAKLGSSNVGSATNPIYLASGTATACTYSLNKTVPSDAVFTDQYVSQSATTTSDYRKIVLSYQNGAAGAAVTSNTNVVYVTANAEVQPSTGNIRSAGTVSAANVSATTNVTGVTLGVATTTGTTGGISLYNGAGSIDTYGIAFRLTNNKGKHGYVQSDWATYFTMSNTDNRGWVFNRASSGNVASISTNGHMVLNGSLTLGGNTTNTSGVRQVYNSTTKSLDFVFVA